MVPSGQATPAFVRLAAHPLRWRLLTELAISDHRVRELVHLLGRPQNLISYHLRLLRTGGLVTARRSSFDARDSYYHLDLERCADALSAAGTVLHPALGMDPAPPPLRAVQRADGPSVLFACTGNSARSPIAEALLRRAGHRQVTSAGSRPKPSVHPSAVRVLRERYGVDIADQRPRHLDTLSRRRFDYVITLCDRVREACPDFPDHPQLIHWSIPDPAAAVTGTAEDAGHIAGHAGDLGAFADVAAEIETRIRYLLPALARIPRQEARP